MKYTLESDFSKHVKREEQHRVYLLYGSQPYLISLYEKLLVKKALDGSFDSFNLHRFETSELDMQAFYDAVESLPFLSGGRCVTLDLEPDKLDSSTFDELCTVLSDPPQTTCVVVAVKHPPSKKERLTKLVKSSPRFQPIPLIIFSSLISEEMRIKGRQLGADEQMSKPEIGHLVRVIDHLLEEGGRRE